MRDRSRLLRQASVDVPAFEEMSSDDTIEEKLMNANVVLEALGNAKTCRNDNSSRFGKWTSLQLNSRGVIIGGQVTQYLLEESRVVAAGPGERNYHIFYQACSILDGYDPGQFNYLNRTGCLSVEGMCDRRSYGDLVDSFRSIGVSREDRNSIFEIIKGILHLGQLEFIEGDGEETKCRLKDTESIARSLEFAGCVLFGSGETDEARGAAGAALRHILSNQKMSMGRETLLVPRTPEQAMATRDSIAKLVYSKLFSYTVQRINDATRAKSRAADGDGGDRQESASVAATIGVLDIFGFEAFDVNSFEQLCINYANEKLQLFFINFLTKEELAVYAREDISVGQVDVASNQPCVQLLEQPGGVFSILNDEVKKRNGSDAGFLEKLYQAQSSHAYFEKPRMGGRQVFTIKHYAENVEYVSDGNAFWTLILL